LGRYPDYVDGGDGVVAANSTTSPLCKRAIDHPVLRSQAGGHLDAVAEIAAEQDGLEPRFVAVAENSDLRAAVDRYQCGRRNTHHVRIARNLEIDPSGVNNGTATARGLTRFLAVTTCADRTRVFGRAAGNQSLESTHQPKEIPVKRVKLHRAIILVAAVALGAASMTSDALARGGGGGHGGGGGGGGGGHGGGGGGGHGGGGFGGGGGHMGGGFAGGGGHMGGGFAGGGGHMGGGFAGGGGHMGGGFGGAHIGGGTGAFAADHSQMGSGHHGDPNGGFRAGHQRHASGRHHEGSYGYYDYGYDNSCLNYPSYYRRNQWGCFW
jgi:hypothetical protein